MTSRKEYWSEEIENDPIDYLHNHLDMGLSDAIDDGYITVDEEELIEGAIATDGIAHFLARYNGNEEFETVDGEDYFIYRTD